MFDLLSAMYPLEFAGLDHETLVHCRRVAVLSCQIGLALGTLTASLLTALKIGGTLHDVGKATIPEAILNKAGRLLPEERILVEQHPRAGADLLLRLAPATHQQVIDIVLHHHERLDGSGYPDRLKGEEISLGARIVAVADMYDALISHRPHREAHTRDEALASLDEEGRQGRLDLRLIGLLRATTMAKPLALRHVRKGFRLPLCRAVYAREA